MEKIENLEVEQEFNSREELLAKLKEVYQEISTQEALKFQRKWRTFESWDSAYDEELNDEFYALVNHSFSKVKEEQKLNEEAKKALIVKANEALSSKNLNESTKLMSDLMSEWKSIRSAGREIDDELWGQFNQARQNFYDMKALNYKNLQEKYQASKVLKEELIEEVKILKDSIDYKVTSDRLNEIMKKWKEAGSSGREFDDTLWNTFNELRQVFYDNKAKHFAALDEQYKMNDEAKKALISEVEAVVNTKYYNTENTEVMKEFTSKWKSIGFSGKENENSNWVKFKALTDNYFEGLTAFNNNRQAMYQERLANRKSSLQAKIESEKRAIERLKNEIIGTISERGVKQLEEEIEDIKEYIKELEEEITQLS